jgi:hypothetical protein
MASIRHDFNVCTPPPPPTVTDGSEGSTVTDGCDAAAEEAAASAERDLYAEYGMEHPADHVPAWQQAEMADRVSMMADRVSMATGGRAAEPVLVRARSAKDLYSYDSAKGQYVWDRNEYDGDYTSKAVMEICAELSTKNKRELLTLALKLLAQQ